ncbi:MAG TPA: NAD(P)H-binding protein [Verrucomicrobiae bacterium]|jgi:NADH dehydrogenase|nr:NAD(P)H-binding protein [Verrucomicrobiae bacterium]
MKIAITGGTGFVGRNIARVLAQAGHEVVLLARGLDQKDPSIHHLPNTHFVATGVNDPHQLIQAFAGCDAVAHCAGINREIGTQTYRRVHIEGTRNVVNAAQQTGVKKIILISFLRARPNCGSGYHESKFAAEEIIRQSGLDYTVFKCGVIYGKGDHMLDHLSHAFYTFPLFAFVGFKDKPIRPNAVEDVARIVKTSLVDGALSRQTVAVLGPDKLMLRQVVRQVAHAVDRHPLMFPMPVWFHYILGWWVERIMRVPLVSVAQVKMLFEGLAEPTPPCEEPPPELASRIHFTDEQIRKGLPVAGSFGLQDIRCCRHKNTIAGHRRHQTFFEMP